MKKPFTNKTDGVTLEQNTCSATKQHFYCVFLKVGAPGTVIYSNLEESLGSAVASDNHQPSTKTATTPTAPSCLIPSRGNRGNGKGYNLQ